MGLFGYNLTLAPVPLAATKDPAGTILQPRVAGATHGPEYDVTSELRGLTALQYAALQVQVAAGEVVFWWDEFREYATGTLVTYDEEHFPNLTVDVLNVGVLVVGTLINLPLYSNVSRPNPASVILGTAIFNTTTNSPNFCGSFDAGVTHIWVDALGNVAL